MLDDDSASRNVIVAALTELGVESVVEFDSGSAGWKQIKTSKFDPTLAISHVRHQ